MMKINANDSVVRPHKIYPTDINNLRFDTLSDNAPIKIVVNVAVTALAATIHAIALGSPEIVLYKKRLKYIFSITHANCPNNPNRISIFLPRKSEIMLLSSLLEKIK